MCDIQEESVLQRSRFSVLVQYFKLNVTEYGIHSFDICESSEFTTIFIRFNDFLTICEVSEWWFFTYVVECRTENETNYVEDLLNS